MCLVAVSWRVCDDAAVVLGANREEAYARGGDPPALHPGPPAFVAGTDPAAGGTWLGVNAAGLVVAVTNRPKTDAPADRRSRGLLVRDLLACPDAAAAADRAAAALAGGRYAGCNVLCLDGEGFTVVQAGDWLRVRALPPGLHVVGNGDVNAETDPRVAAAFSRLGGRRPADSAEALTALAGLCADPAVVVRGPDRGTVSSTLLAVRHPAHAGTLLHAQGPPDDSAYADLSYLLSGLTW